MNREALYSALFAFFSAIEGGAVFKTATRKPTTWDQVAAEDQPALLMLQRRERYENRKGLPARVWLYVDLYIYVHTGAQNDPEVISAQLLNPVLDAIDAALTVDDPSNNACTLGGLVSHCAISGEIEIHTGDLGDQAAAIVPLELLTTQ